MKKKDNIGRMILGESYDAIENAIKQTKAGSLKSKKQLIDYKAATLSLIEQNRKLVFDLLKKGKL